MDLIKTALGKTFDPRYITVLNQIGGGPALRFFSVWFPGYYIVFCRPEDNSYGYDYLEGMTLEEMHDHIEEAMRRAKGGDHHHDGPRR